MIATVKILGLRARDFATLSVAARRVVEYVQGGPASARRSPGNYYSGGDVHSARVTGTARGTATGLVGLRGDVDAEQLHRLLLGRHAVTGAWLLQGRGSAGRALARRSVWLSELGDVPETLTLAQAARVAGVSATYLRRLAENHELAKTVHGDPGPAVDRDERPSVAAGGQAALGLDVEPRRLPGGDRDVLRAFRDPVGRRWLVTKRELGRFMAERQPPTVVIGYDLTCSAPKSVSLLWAFGDADLRADIEAALEAGVDAAIGYLERHAVVGNVGGRNRTALGLAAASYRHEISRSEEAHLHVHNIVVNAAPIPVLDDDGRPVLDEAGVGRVEWRALDGEVLLRHVKAAGYVGAAALRHELARRRGVEWGPVRNGVAELAAFPKPLLEAFSTRTGELTEEFLQLVEAGFTADAGTVRAAQRGSRAAKRVLSDPQVEAIQRRKLIETGWTVEGVRQLGATRKRSITPLSDAELGELFDRMVGPGGLTEQRPLFTQREVHQYVAAAVGDRLDAAGIADLAERFLSDPRIVLMRIPGKRRRNQDEDTYSTLDLLETEDALMALYRQGRVDHGGTPRAPVNGDVVEAAIDATNQRLREVRPPPTGPNGVRYRRPGQRRRAGTGTVGLSEEQADLVRRLLASGDLVRPVVGPAGTGKTEAMRAVVAALTAAGYTVYGTANGGRQAEDLHERLHVPSQVVSGWLTRLDHAADPAGVWRPGTVLILDEATQVATRDAERLLRYATRTGAVVVLVGDVAQLGSVGAGGWFRHLVQSAAGLDAAGVPGLRLNQRQTGPQLRQVRAALAALRRDLPAADQQALRLLARDGRIRVFDTPEQMLAGVVDDWYAERRPTTTVSTTTSSEGSAVVGGAAAATELASRSRMMAEHHRDVHLLNTAARVRLAADGTLSGPQLRVAGRSFQAGDEVITLTQAGHTLIPHGRPPSAYIRTGTLGIVTAVHTDPAHPQRQGLTVLFPGRGEASVDWDYLTHAFPDGRDGGLGHAYALTAHKAEGATMPTARSVVADDTSRAGLYVMLSRAKRNLRAYLIRRPDLEAHLEDEDWLPVLHDGTGPMRRLLDHLAESRPERLASEHDPTARAAHQLAAQHTLAELTRIRRAALPAGAEPGTGSIGQDPDPQVDPLVARRAELAAETITRHTAIAHPPPQLIARIGPRPDTGPDRSVWDDAVAALALYHARHLAPGIPADRLPSEPAPDAVTPEQSWQEQRRRAEVIAAAWAENLGPARCRRFRSQQEAVPRRRAIAGVHALLAAGRAPEQVAAELEVDGVEDVRAGAPVLEYRVRALLNAAGLDPAPYDLPAPLTPHQEWTRAAALLDAAQARYLATRPTGDLLAERRELTSILTDLNIDLDGDIDDGDAHRPALLAAVDRAGGAHDTAQRVYDVVHTHLTTLELQRRPDPATLAAVRDRLHQRRQELADRSLDLDLARTRLRANDGDETARRLLHDRLSLIDEALEHQIGDAAARLAREPAPYLTALLGHRPDAAAAAHEWNQHAITVERYRHTALGLPYGTPAAALTGPASHAALGPPPEDPDLAREYARLQGLQPTLDFEPAL